MGSDVSKPAAVTDEQIDAVWVQVFRNIPGGPRDVRQSHRDFARKVLALATRTPEPQAERGKVLVPLRPTRAMDEVMQQDDWRWADLLEAAEAVTEEEYAQSDASDVPPTPETQAEQQSYSYASTQATECAGCGKRKHTPLRIDAMGGYVCLTCIDQKLGTLLGEFGYPQPEPQPDSRGQAREGWTVEQVKALNAANGEIFGADWPETFWQHAAQFVNAALAASPTPDEQRAQAAQEGGRTYALPPLPAPADSINKVSSDGQDYDEPVFTVEQMLDYAREAVGMRKDTGGSA